MKQLLLGSAGMGLPAALSAQYLNDPRQPDTAEIVVSAAAISKRDVTLAKMPQNITVTDQELIERQRATRIEDTLHCVLAVQRELTGQSLLTSCFFAGSAHCVTSAVMAGAGPRRIGLSVRRQLARPELA